MQHVTKWAFGAGALALALLAGGLDAAAQTKVEIQTTASNDYLPAFMAKEAGLLSKEGIEANFALSTAPGTLPAALMADSIQIATITAPQLAAARAAGIDLVVIAAGGRERKATPAISVVVTPDSGIKSPADFAGKTIAVPAVGAVLDIGFKQWLKSKSADPTKVRFVEIGFGQMPEAMKAGQVQGALLPEPFRSRIVGSGAGTKAGDFIADIAGDALLSFYVSTRAWATAHKDAITGFRKALDGGFERIASNEAEAKAAEAKYLKLPPQVIETLPLPKRSPVTVSPSELQFWLDTCAELGIVATRQTASEMLWP